MIGQGSTTGKGLFYMSYVYQKFGFTMELGQYEAFMDAMFDVVSYLASAERDLSLHCPHRILQYFQDFQGGTKRPMDLVKLQQPRETTFRAPKMNSVEIPFFQHGQSEVGEI